jgi:hypothetical protein
MKPDLSDARQKLNRAGHHIAHLDAWINGRLNADYYRLTIEPENGDRLSYNFQSLHDLGRDAEAIIGDAIGNLRSTLDYIVAALVLPITGKCKDTGFPFANDANGFAGEVRAQRCFGLLPKTLQNAIIDNVQAYKGGKGEPLWALNQLRNIDKHRLLITTFRLASITVSFQDVNRNHGTIQVGVAEGQKAGVINAPMGHVQLTSKPQPIFEITINEPPFIERTEALAFLQTCADQVERVLKTVEAAFC